MKLVQAGILLMLAACAAAPQGSIARDATPTVVSNAPAFRIERAWVHAAPQGQFETWAFATIVNLGEADALVAVESADAGSAVLRAVTLTDAGRKMRSVASIPVPAHSSLALTVDGYFIAFIEARHAFVAGQSVTATLHFASGVSIAASFMVNESEGDPADRGN
jgi:copper(I)-binding protein